MRQVSLNITNLPAESQDLALGSCYWIFSENIENTLRLIVNSGAAKIKNPISWLISDEFHEGLIHKTNYEIPADTNISFFVTKGKNNILSRLSNLEKIGNLNGRTIFVVFGSNLLTEESNTFFRKLLQELQERVTASQACVVLVPTGFHEQSHFERVRNLSEYLAGLSELYSEKGKWYYHIDFWNDEDSEDEELRVPITFDGKKFEVLMPSPKPQVVEAPSPAQATPLKKKLPPWMSSSSTQTVNQDVEESSFGEKVMPEQPKELEQVRTKRAWQEQIDKLKGLHEDPRDESSEPVAEVEEPQTPPPPPQEKKLEDRIAEQERLFSSAEEEEEEPPKKSFASRWFNFPWRFGRRKKAQEEQQAAKEEKPRTQRLRKAEEQVIAEKVPEKKVTPTSKPGPVKKETVLPIPKSLEIPKFRSFNAK